MLRYKLYFFFLTPGFLREMRKLEAKINRKRKDAFIEMRHVSLFCKTIGIKLRTRKIGQFLFF